MTVQSSHGGEKGEEGEGDCLCFVFSRAFIQMSRKEHTLAPLFCKILPMKMAKKHQKNIFKASIG